MLSQTEIQNLIAAVDAGTYDLQDALNDIASAQKGEDVRKALYSEAYTLQKEGKAGSVDLVVRNQIDQFINEHSGNQMATTLWSDNDGVGVDESLVTLSAACDGYDFIDVYWRNGIGGESPGVYTYSGTDFKDGVVINALNLYTEEGYLSPDLFVFEMHIMPTTTPADGVHFMTDISAKWSWDGSDTSSAEITGAASSAVAGDLFKIVGRKMMVDAEVVDIRSGADGVSYQTAGAAVRGQLDKKVNIPLSSGSPTNGTSGQFLQTNGDGTTAWASVEPNDGTCTFTCGSAFETVNFYSARVGKLAHFDFTVKTKQALTAGTQYTIGTLLPAPANAQNLRIDVGASGDDKASVVGASTNNLKITPSEAIATNTVLYISATYIASV